jgi:hypothetical protein
MISRCNEKVNHPLAWFIDPKSIRESWEQVNVSCCQSSSLILSSTIQPKLVTVTAMTPWRLSPELKRLSHNGSFFLPFFRPTCPMSRSIQSWPSNEIKLTVTKKDSLSINDITKTWRVLMQLTGETLRLFFTDCLMEWVESRLWLVPIRWAILELHVLQLINKNFISA